MKKKVWWAVLLLLLVGLGSLSIWWIMPENKERSQPVRVPKTTLRLVAIGDSLTYGVGDQANDGGYVGQIKARLQQHLPKTKVITSNYGVSGDRSDQILKRLQNQSQMQVDLRKADVIVMTVGGNDLLQTLEKELLTNSPKNLQQALERAGDTYQQKLTTLLQAVRQENSHAPLFLFSIYDPVYVYFPEVHAITDGVTKWNQISETTMQKFGPSYFVNIDRQLSYGQYQSVASREKLAQQAAKANRASISQAEVLKVMSGQGKNLNRYISTKDNFHPNHAGYGLMTTALWRQMQAHDSFMYQK